MPVAGRRDIRPADEIRTIDVSNDVVRGIADLSAGFPPSNRAAWWVEDTHHAWEIEGTRLERLRMAGHSIGGGFAMVPKSLAGALLD